MLKELYLLRHGEAESAYHSKDFERSLTPKGASDIAALARQLKMQNFYPDHIYCSTAERTQQTALILTEQLDYSLPIEYLNDIYEAPVKTLFDLVVSTNEEHKSVLLVGHNPGLSYLYDYLTKSFGNLSPGDILKIEFENQTWAEISKGTGRKADL